tara:strand:- start:110 stop:556 length:447 start_codon:yes stop_codon:yes gene_type:complete
MSSTQEFDLEPHLIHDVDIEKIFDTLLHLRRENLIPGSKFTEQEGTGEFTFTCTSDLPSVLNMFVSEDATRTYERLFCVENDTIFHVVENKMIKIVTKYEVEKDDVIIKVYIHLLIQLPFIPFWGFRRYLMHKATELRHIEEHYLQQQ